MADDYVYADLVLFEKFKNDSADAISEFKQIKTDYETLNTNLMKQWKGQGAEAYKLQADHIMENIGDFETNLNTLNEEVVQVILDEYSKVDEELAAINLNPEKASESSEG